MSVVNLNLILIDRPCWDCQKTRTGRYYGFIIQVRDVVYIVCMYVAPIGKRQ